MLVGLTDLEKKVIENCNKSKVTKNLIFPISSCQRETTYKFDKLKN